jgi:ribonuclease BN (tRNA processing enzyme)
MKIVDKYQVVDPIFPAKVWVFNLDGTYNKPYRVLEGVGELTVLLKEPAFKQFFKNGHEIRITDPMDNCLFHAKDGKIIFAGDTA